MPDLKPLFPHQQQIVDGVRASFAASYTRVMIYAATGIGKTVIACHIVRGALDKGKKALFIAPYITLINQTAKSFMDQGIPQPGIIQADHPWTNSAKSLQIASVQTLSRRAMPDTDLIIVDEAHINYKETQRIIRETNIPVIGLSATPYTRGLGRHYNSLVNGPPMRWLINAGFLSDYVVYSHDKPDLSQVKTVRTTEGIEYDEAELGDTMMDPKLVGCVIQTWLKHGQNRQTICFCVNVAHAEFVCSEFEKIGVSVAVVTAKTKERDLIYERFKTGEIKMLVNVFVLVAGFDAPVECLIDAAPTKSESRHVQKGGRGLRTGDDFWRVYLDYKQSRPSGNYAMTVLFICACVEDIPRIKMTMLTMHCNANNDQFIFDIEDRRADVKIRAPKIKKDFCLVLDHAGNWSDGGLGFPDDIYIDDLCNGEKKQVKERREKREKEKKESAPTICPKCKFTKQAKVHTCPQCGFTPKFIENVEVQDGELKLINSKEKKMGKDEKQDLWSQIMGLKKLNNLRKGKPKADGYYYHLYKEKTGVSPIGLKDTPKEPSESLLAFVKHKQIAYAKRKSKK